MTVVSGRVRVSFFSPVSGENSGKPTRRLELVNGGGLLIYFVFDQKKPGRVCDEFGPRQRVQTRPSSCAPRTRTLVETPPATHCHVLVSPTPWNLIIGYGATRLLLPFYIKNNATTTIMILFSVSTLKPGGGGGKERPGQTGDVNWKKYTYIKAPWKYSSDLYQKTRFIANFLILLRFPIRGTGNAVHATLAVKKKKNEYKKLQ